MNIKNDEKLNEKIEEEINKEVDKMMAEIIDTDKWVKEALEKASIIDEGIE